MKTIFYSWMSDCPNNTNRGLIKDALEKAAREAYDVGEVQDSPRIDHDTKDLPGSPDIFEAICDKIDRSETYVADVTLMPDRGNGRPMPNPNVLIELGYALKAHNRSLSRIILVMNTKYGFPKELPFNFGFKRVVTYEASEDLEERRVAKKTLVGKLKSQLKSIRLDVEDQEKANTVGKWLGDLFLLLSEMLPELDIFGEWDENGQIDHVANLSSDWTRRLYKLADDSNGQYLEGLSQFAENCDKFSRELHDPRLGTNYDLKAENLFLEANRIKEEWLDGNPFDESTLSGIRTEIVEAGKDLEIVEKRIENGSYDTRPLEMFYEAGTAGDRLLRFAYFDLSLIGIDSEELKRLSKPISLLQHMRLISDGGERIRTAERQIQECVARLNEALRM